MPSVIWPYDEEHPVHYSTSPILWKWLCYGDGENCLSYYGEIVMNGYASGEWPLSKGPYIMILKRGGTVCCVWSGEEEIETHLIFCTSIQVLTKDHSFIDFQYWRLRVSCCSTPSYQTYSLSEQISHLQAISYLLSYCLSYLQTSSSSRMCRWSLHRI